MQRREFLRLGGVCGAAVAVASAPAARGLLAAPTALARYCEVWGGPLIDAAALACGDSKIARNGIRFTVFGFTPDHAAWRGRASLDVLFPQQGWQAPFHAWSYRGVGPAGSARATSFVVPVDEAGRLELDATWNDLPFPLVLSTGSDPGLPKLRSGIYQLSIKGARSFVAAPPIVVTVDAARSELRSSAPWRIEHV